MRTVIRPLHRLALVLTLALAILASAPALAAAQGNADAAHACRDGGHAAVIGTDGTAFGSVGECVQHAAAGGALVTTEAAGPCLDGGWASLAPAETFWVAFPDLGTCLEYVAAGGTPVAAWTGSIPTAWAGVLPSEHASGSCGGHYLFTNLDAGTTYWFVAYRGDGSVWFVNDHTPTGTETAFRIQYLVAPLLADGEATWAAVYMSADLAFPIAVSDTATCAA